MYLIAPMSWLTPLEVMTMSPDARLLTDFARTTTRLIKFHWNSLSMTSILVHLFTETKDYTLTILST